MAHQVNSPDRANINSGGDNEITPEQLINSRHQLHEVAGLPRDVHDFISSNRAPENLRKRHDTLFRNTSMVFDTINIHHRMLTGDISAISNTTTGQLMSSIERLISKWDDLRGALQHAMEAHAEMPEAPASPERYLATLQPSGSIRMSSLIPSPYRN